LSQKEKIDKLITVNIKRRYLLNLFEVYLEIIAKCLKTVIKAHPLPER